MRLRRLRYRRSGQKRFIAVWSMLHGMISLYNSKIVSYTTQDPEAMYEKLIAEFMQILSRP